jgi:choline dehydrogenase
MAYDYVIVGAGSAGCVLAARLSEDAGTSVLLLEAGPRDTAKEIRIPAAFSKLFRSKFDWGYDTAPQPGLENRRIFFPRGKTLGGSSAMNAQMWLPGYPADHDAWPEGWRWPDVAPYYERIHRGPISLKPLRDPNPMSEAFVQCASACGVEASLVTVTQRYGLRHSAADAYLKPARRRPNLTVRTDLEVEAVVPGGVRAGGEVIQAQREVILSAGAIGSPRLLLRSGIDVAGVGENLSDHPLAIALFEASGKDSLFAAESPVQLLRLLTRRRGMLTSNVGEAAAFVSTREGLPGPDLELIFGPVLYQGEGLVVPDAHGFSIGAVALQPRSRGRVTLEEIDPGYLNDPEDVRVLVHGIELARRIAKAGPLGRWLTRERAPGDVELEPWIRQVTHTIYHPVGTCALGTVVDSELRVRGVERLRVVDASVIPVLPRGHTHAPTVMVAERAADLITQRA